MSIWSFPTKIVFGAGEITRLGQEAKALGLQRVLLVADAGVEKNGLLTAPLAALKQAGIETSVFTRVDGNPTEQNIEDGAKAYAAQRAEGVVAVGGGSPSATCRSSSWMTPSTEACTSLPTFRP